MPSASGSTIIIKYKVSISAINKFLLFNGGSKKIFLNYHNNKIIKFTHKGLVVK